MNLKKDVKSKALTNTKSFFLEIRALHLFFIIPVLIPLVLSIYIVIGCFYMTSFLLLLSPLILIIHYVFPQLPIHFGSGNPSVIIEFFLIGLLFVLGLILFRMLRKISQSFHLKIKQLNTRFIEWIKIQLAWT